MDCYQTYLYPIEVDSVSGDSLIKLDVVKQICLILNSHLSDILQYKKFLKQNDNGDVLYNCKCSCCNSSSSVIHLHILLSIDGTNPYKKRNYLFGLYKQLF